MKKYSTYLFTGLRILIGWHFLYEGIAKLLTPGWTAKMYLLGSNWIFSDFFHQMAASPGIMKAVDFLNIWGLILVGLSLFIGLAVRWSSIAGALLLVFYFVAYPPIPAAKSEGVPLERREVLRDLISLPVLGAFAYAVYKKSKWDRYQKVSSATWISTRVRPWRG